MRALPFFLIILCLLAAAPAYAVPGLTETPLRFRAPSNDLREQSAIAHLTSEKELLADLPFEVADADLNGDGVGEWVVRQDTASNCAAQATCAFMVVGLKDRSPALLFKTQAAKVNIYSRKFFGVHSLMVYANTYNDLEGREYGWNPYKSTFSPP